MRIVVGLVGLLVAGCVTVTPGFYYKNGKRGDATPALLGELQQAKAICNGKSAASLMNATQPGLRQPQLAQYVFEGCMAEQGWQIRPN